MRYIYLVNAFNLKDKTQAMIDKLETVSGTLGRDYEIIKNSSVAQYQANIERYRTTSHIITAIGGDGSINHVLNDIIDSDNILAFIPHGTGNDFYKTCLETFTPGTHEIDVVRINDRYFINTACFGIDADIANDDRFIHNRFIPMAMRYNAGVIYHFLTYKPRQLKLEIDNHTLEGYYTTIVVGNGRYYGSGYKVSPYSIADDGLFEVIVAERLNKISMAKVILSMKDASHLKNPAVYSFTGSSCVISSEVPIKANIDGEDIEAKSFELELLRKRFRIDFDPEFLNRMLKK